MPDDRPVFTARDGDLFATVYEDAEGRRRIELAKSYEEGGERTHTTRLGYVDHERGKAVHQAAKDWIRAQDQAEGAAREAERRKQEPKMYSGEPAGARFRRLAHEKRQAAGADR